VATSTHIPWTRRRRHFTRAELATALAESFDGAGPVHYEVGPLEHVRFAVKLTRQSLDGRTLLDAEIPAPSNRGSVARRVLADRGWPKTDGPGTRYYRRRFTDAGEAVAAIVAAYEAVYGSVGDDRGWTIREAYATNDPVWETSRWIGEEDQVVGRSAKAPTALHKVLIVAIVGVSSILPNPSTGAQFALGAITTILVLLPATLVAVRAADRLWDRLRIPVALAPVGAAAAILAAIGMSTVASALVETAIRRLGG